MLLKKNFLEQGFTCINHKEYLRTQEEYESLETLQTYYQTELEKDGPRQRAYLKLKWDRMKEQISIAQNQIYFQSPKNNNLDGGKLRQFKVMNPNVLNLSIVQKLIQVNKDLIMDYKPLADIPNLVLGMHFIRYCSNKLEACYSSPVGLHLDDEPLVFVHLVQLSQQSLGGDNLIARLEDQEITHVIRLEEPMETIVLNNNCFHAVTPLGSREGLSIRDIILFTVEPETTQMIAASAA